MKTTHGIGIPQAFRALGKGCDLPATGNPPLLVWVDVDGAWQIDMDPNPPVEWAVYATWHHMTTALENVEIELDALCRFVEDGGSSKGIVARIEDSKATAREARR